MKIFRSTGKFIYKTFLDVPAWLGFSQLKQGTFSLASNLQQLFIPRTSGRSETFEEARTRLKLTEQEIQQRARFFRYQIFIFMGVGIACLFYVIFLFIYQYLLAGVVAFFVCGLFFVKAFAAHFWYMQIKRRKLGCTLKEWVDYLCKRDRS